MQIYIFESIIEKIKRSFFFQKLFNLLNIIDGRYTSGIYIFSYYVHSAEFHIFKFPINA